MPTLKVSPTGTYLLVGDTHVTKSNEQVYSIAMVKPSVTWWCEELTLADTGRYLIDIRYKTKVTKLHLYIVQGVVLHCKERRL